MGETSFEVADPGFLASSQFSRSVELLRNCKRARVTSARIITSPSQLDETDNEVALPLRIAGVGLGQTVGIARSSR